MRGGDRGVVDGVTDGLFTFNLLQSKVYENALASGDASMNLPIIAALIAVCCVLVAGLIRANAASRQLRLELSRANEALKAKDEVLSRRSELDTIKDEFISTASHELRTPLTSIKGALGLLSAGLMGSADAKANHLLRIALTNTDRLIRLINDILDLERMQSGRAPLHIRRCSISELAQHSIETMTPLAEAAKVRIELILAAPPDAMFLDGDSDRMEQVLTNLLSNAIKFSPQMGVVEVRIEADTDSLLLRVSDQGRGVPPNRLDAIFDRFEQVEEGDQRQKGGTGLGLAICRTIIQQHNGSIWAESNVQQHRGPGTSVLVTLPRVTRIQDARATAALTMLPGPGAGTIVLCDDDLGIRTVVSESLQRYGYNVLPAENGEEAIRLAANAQVSAVLLDLYMPGMTGWETLQRMKDTPEIAEIPVIVLSVLSPNESSINTSRIAASAQGWVQKPYNEHLLLAELARVLRSGEGPARVLLVEDDVDLASVVMTGFDESSVQFEHAHTGQAAIRMCQSRRPDLVILDLSLPDGDGFSLVEWMRRQPEMRTLPLVVYSGREVSEMEKSQLRLGPTQFLTKAKVQPKDVEELVLKIVHRGRPKAGRAPIGRKGAA